MANLQAQAAQGISGAPDGFPVVLNGRFEIATDLPGGAPGAPRARAHAARDRLNEDHAVFALVCDPEIPPRFDAIQALKDFSARGILRLLDSGVVPWPEGSDHRYVLVFERPSGVRLATDLTAAFDPLPESEVIARMIAPVADLLEALHGLGITHRAIRPTNMFMSREQGGPAVLGECVSTPPAFDQPPVFESIQSLQAMPAGRGSGTRADDIYALGVTALALFIGRDPGEGRDAATLLTERMERGSYATLTAAHRLPAGLREALRGMLEDRPELRWTVDDLRSWLAERRLKTVHHAHLDRAQRAFAFAGRSHYHPRTLAQALAADWSRVRLADKGHEILGWTRRSIGDDVMGNHVLAAMESSERGGDGAANPAFVARLAMALDPRAPVRYRHIAAHTDGFGPLIAVHYGDGETLQAAVEALAEDLPGFRARTSDQDEGGRMAAARALGTLARHLRNPAPGHGIERCLYTLNPTQYCRSPLIADQKVMRAADLLPALEKVSGRSHGGPPFDNHIAAFAAAHLRVELQSLLVMAGDPRDPERAALGMLGVLATLQVQTGCGSCPGVARWLGGYLRPVVDSFRHRMWREKVEHEMPGLIERGDIAALYMYLANGEIRQRDRNGYAEAVAEYARLTAEISFLKSHGYTDPVRTEEYGHQIAAGLTGIVSIAAMALCAVLLI